MKYPDSDVVYESEAVIDRWLSGDEQPDLFGGLGLSMYTPEVPPVVGQVVAGERRNEPACSPATR